jgi:hypothetical protein
MKKKLWILVFLILSIVAGCHKETKVVLPKNKDSDFAVTSNYGDYNNQEKLLFQFVDNKMITNEGIYTNYLNIKKSDQNNAVGHEMLSESSGFWLEYLIYQHKYKKFREFYKKTKKTLTKELNSVIDMIQIVIRKLMLMLHWMILELFGHCKCTMKLQEIINIVMKPQNVLRC